MFTTEELQDISTLNEVQKMDCWPSGNSMAVVGDTLVIKLSDKGEVIE